MPIPQVPAERTVERADRPAGGLRPGEPAGQSRQASPGLRSVSFSEAFEGMPAAPTARSRPTCGPCWPSPMPRSRST